MKNKNLRPKPKVSAVRKRHEPHEDMREEKEVVKLKKNNGNTFAMLSPFYSCFLKFFFNNYKFLYIFLSRKRKNDPFSACK